MCCTWLAENAGCKKLPKILHLGTIVQLCWAVSLQLRHVSTIGKVLKSSISSTCRSQYGELRPTNGWDRFTTLGHSSKFQRVSCLGSVTAWHASSGHPPNLAALNRERHLYSAGRPSRSALAHILVNKVFDVICVTIRLSRGWPSIERRVLRLERFALVNWNDNGARSVILLLSVWLLPNVFVTFFSCCIYLSCVLKSEYIKLSEIVFDNVL